MNDTSSNSNKYGWVSTCDKTKYPEGHMNDEQTLWTYMDLVTHMNKHNNFVLSNLLLNDDTTTLNYQELDCWI